MKDGSPNIYIFKLRHCCNINGSKDLHLKKKKNGSKDLPALNNLVLEIWICVEYIFNL